MDVDEAQRALEDLIGGVLAGEEVVLTRDGQPVARLVAAPGHDDKALVNRVAALEARAATSVSGSRT